MGGKDPHTRRFQEKGPCGSRGSVGESVAETPPALLQGLAAPFRVQNLSQVLPLDSPRPPSKWGGMRAVIVGILVQRGRHSSAEGPSFVLRERGGGQDSAPWVPLAGGTSLPGRVLRYVSVQGFPVPGEAGALHAKSRVEGVKAPGAFPGSRHRGQGFQCLLAYHKSQLQPRNLPDGLSLCRPGTAAARSRDSRVSGFEPAQS